MTWRQKFPFTHLQKGKDNLDICRAMSFGLILWESLWHGSLAPGQTKKKVGTEEKG